VPPTKRRVLNGTATCEPVRIQYTVPAGSIRMADKLEKKVKPVTKGTVAIWNDQHVPYHDRKVMDLFFGFCKEVQPSTIVFNGDFMDFNQFSTKFNEAPEDVRDARIGYAVRAGRAILQGFREDFPRSEIIFLPGNHEHRVTKWLQRKAPWLMDPEVRPSIESFLLTHKHDVIVHPYGTAIQFGDMGVTHGEIVRKFGGYTAKALVEQYGQSMLCGHTHRAGVHHRTLGGKQLTGIENGCSCLMQQPYTVGPNDWQHAWTFVEYTKRKAYPELVVLEDYRYSFRGTKHEYRGLPRKHRISRSVPSARPI
jgi:UDP-2,3-diacylglucosamine pyrophosphatase LpxH